MFKSRLGSARYQPYICAPNAIVIFLGVVIKDKIVKFSNNCGTYTIKEIGGGENTNYGISKDNNINKLSK